MTERIKITLNNIITKSADGTVTFDTNKNYIKTDSNRIIKAGGYKSTPTVTGTSGTDRTIFFGTPSLSDHGGGWFCVPQIGAGYGIPRFTSIRHYNSNTWLRDYGSVEYWVDPTTDTSPYLYEWSVITTGTEYTNIYYSSTLPVTTDYNETIGTFRWVVKFVMESATESAPRKYNAIFPLLCNLNITNFNHAGSVTIFSMPDILSFTRDNGITPINDTNNGAPVDISLGYGGVGLITIEEPISLNLGIT